MQRSTRHRDDRERVADITADDRGRRLAHNEVLFKRANAAISHRADERGEPASRPIAFFCECADIDCAERILIRGSEYERVRAAPTQFLIVPGHEAPSVEVVVARTPGYNVVEKSGAAARHV